MTFAIDLPNLSVVVTEEADLVYLDNLMSGIPMGWPISELACVLATELCPGLGIHAFPASGWEFAFTTMELADSFNKRLSHPVKFEEVVGGGTPPAIVEAANTVIGIQHQ